MDYLSNAVWDPENFTIPPYSPKPNTIPGHPAPIIIQTTNEGDQGFGTLTHAASVAEDFTQLGVVKWQPLVLSTQKRKGLELPWSCPASHVLTGPT